MDTKVFGSLLGWLIFVISLLVFRSLDFAIFGVMLAIGSFFFMPSYELKNRYYSEIAEDYWNREYLDYSNKPFASQKNTKVG